MATNDDWEDVKNPGGTATADDDEWEDVPSAHKTAPATAATEENLPSSTPRLRAAAGKTFQKPTRTEKETPQIPENYGFTPGNVLGNIYEGAKGAVGSAAQGLYDLTFGEGKNAQGEEQHGLGGLVGMNAEGKIDPIGRLKWLGEKYITDPYKQEAEKARQLEEQSRQEETAGTPGSVSHATSAVGHRIASMVPLVGPWAASLGEQAGTGDVGGAAGQATGAVLGGEAAAHPLETVKAPLKLADKVVRGTPLTEAGKLAAAQKQILTVKPPRMSETEYAQTVSNVMPDMQRIAQDNRGKIKNPEDASDAITNRIGQMESPISTQLQTQPTTPVPVNDVVASADRHIDSAFKQNLSHFSDKEKMAAKQEVLNLIGNNPDISLFEMERIRRRLDSEASAYYRSKPADQRLIAKSEATAVTQRATANAMRDMLYGDAANPGLLEQAGIQAVDVDGRPVPIREFRKRVGDLINVRDHFEDAIVDAQKKGNWSAFQVAKSGPSLAAGGAGAVVGGFAHTIPGALFGLLLGEGAKVWTDYLRSKNPNLNTIKAFRNLADTSRPNTFDVQTTPLRAPAPAAPAAQLPAPATQMPGPVNLGGSPGFQNNRWVNPAGQLPPPAPITPQFLREIPQGGLGRVNGPPPQLPEAAASLVPRETNVPPIVGDEYAREEVRPTAEAAERAPETQLGTVGRQGIVQRVAGELPKNVPARAIQDTIDELRLREKDLRKQGNSGAANAIAQRISKLEEQVPAGFEETPPQRPRVAGETVLGKIGDKEGLPKKKVSTEEEGVPYTKPMPIPAGKVWTSRGVTAESVLHHELAHLMLAGIDGFVSNGVSSHRHPLSKGTGATASVLFPRAQFRDPVTGGFDTDVVKNKGSQLADLFAAGAASDELLHGIDRKTNPGLYGDRKLAKQLFQALDIPEDQHEAMFDAAVDRAKERLSHPGIVDLMKREASIREEGLPVEFHFSKNRAENIVRKAKGLYEQRGANQGTGAAVGDAGGEEAVSAGEKAGAGESATGAARKEKIKPFTPPKNIYTFTIEGAPGSAEDLHVTEEALTRKKAFDQIIKRVPGAGMYRMVKEEAPTVETIPFTKLRERPLQMKAKGEDGPVSVADIGQALGKYSQEKFGAVSDKEAVDRAIKMAIPEIKYQMATDNSGLGWYEADTQKAVDAMTELHPELKDPKKAALFKTFWSALSYGKNPADNMMLAEKAYNLYKETGKMPITQPDGKAWGVYKAGHEGNMRSTQALIDKFGENGAVDWLLSKHPTSELKQFNKNVSGKATDQQYGAVIYGPKGGNFYLNLNGVPDLVTVDKWATRTWQRWTGRLTGKNVDDAPGPGEIRNAREAIARVGNKLGIEPRDAQAVLWYYEQELYKAHGAKGVEPLSYGNEAQRIVQERKTRDVQPERGRSSGGGVTPLRKAAKR